MYKAILGLAALLLSTVCSAGVTHGPSASIALGKNIVKNQFGDHQSFERAVMAGYRVSYNSFFAQVNAGFYMAQGDGRKNSGWGSLVCGVHVRTTSGLSAYVGVGPAYLTTPDYVVLSGHLQYDIRAGLCLSGAMDICLAYTHLSNCHGCPLIGGREPNIGLDLVGVAFNF